MNVAYQNLLLAFQKQEWWTLKELVAELNISGNYLHKAIHMLQKRHAHIIKRRVLENQPIQYSCPTAGFLTPAQKLTQSEPTQMNTSPNKSRPRKALPLTDKVKVVNWITAHRELAYTHTAIELAERLSKELSMPHVTHKHVSYTLKVLGINPRALQASANGHTVAGATARQDEKIRRLAHAVNFLYRNLGVTPSVDLEELTH